MGRSSGMGLDVESSGAGDGFPLGCGSSLGLGCVTGQSRVNIVHSVCIESRGSCHLPRRAYDPIPFHAGGTPRHSVLETPFESLRTGLDSAPASADLRQGERNPLSVGRVPSGMGGLGDEFGPCGPLLRRGRRARRTTWRGCRGWCWGVGGGASTSR